MTGAVLALDFELERGDADSGEAPPCVWRVDEAPGEAMLAQRFEAEWAGWYGPELAAAAARIGHLLASRPQARAGSVGSAAVAAPAFGDERMRLPIAWLMPLVRRRRRQLSIWLPAAAMAGQADPGARLLLDLQLFWGATSRPGLTSGAVEWQACALHEQLPCASVAWPAGGPAQLLLARQLRGGVGLLLVRPQRLGQAGPAAAAG